MRFHFKMTDFYGREIRITRTVYGREVQCYYHDASGCNAISVKEYFRVLFANGGFQFLDGVKATSYLTFANNAPSDWLDCVNVMGYFDFDGLRAVSLEVKE